MARGVQSPSEPRADSPSWGARDATNETREHAMLRWALIFLVVALIAAALGFTGLAGAAAGMAQILFWVFLVVFLVMLLLGRRAGNVV
jgi:uncharacterized membrane protein YtjA (UPF0391 family)